jgi:hypothetical protein
VLVLVMGKMDGEMMEEEGKGKRCVVGEGKIWVEEGGIWARRC